MKGFPQRMRDCFLLLGSLCIATAAAGPAQWSNICDAQVAALATGIHLNIVGQYAEYNSTVNLLNIESAKPVDQSSFLVAKGELISVIMSGIKIRTFNQEIAPAGNPALPGLAKYAMAQSTELALAQGLTGDPSHDTTSLNSLKSDIMSGIQLNEMNLKEATSVCTFTLQFPAADQ